MNSYPKILNNLQAVVMEESLCLKSGNFQSLTDIIVKKTKILKELEQDLINQSFKPDIISRAHQLRQVQQKLHDTSILMRSALNGVKSAQQRLELLRRMDWQTGTYNRSGQRVEISQSAGRKNKFI